MTSRPRGGFMHIRKIVDLSVVVDPATQVYPGDPQPAMAVATTIRSHGYNLLSLRLGSQTGTHVDSPYHFLETGPRLDDCDLALFVGGARVIDLRSHEPRQRVLWRDIEPQVGDLGHRK